MKRLMMALMVVGMFAGCQAEELPADDVAEMNQSLDNGPGPGGITCTQQCSEDQYFAFLMCNTWMNFCLQTPYSTEFWCNWDYKNCVLDAQAEHTACNNRCYLKQLPFPGEHL